MATQNEKVIHKSQKLGNIAWKPEAVGNCIPAMFPLRCATTQYCQTILRSEISFWRTCNIPFKNF